MNELFLMITEYLLLKQYRKSTLLMACQPSNVNWLRFDQCKEFVGFFTADMLLIGLFYCLLYYYSTFLQFLLFLLHCLSFRLFQR